jgi:hypothetical protein
MPLINCIIKALEKGTIKRVVAFSDMDTAPDVPYVVVKSEAGSIENTRQYRIIVHHRQGYSDELNEYAMAEIDRLLPGTVDAEDGSRYKLYKGGYTDITPEKQDNAFFMERIFYAPLPGFNS